MSEVRVVSREAFFIKKSDLKPAVFKKIIDNYTLMFFEEKICSDCEWHQDRLESETKLSAACENCAAFKGGVGLAKEVKIGSSQYLSTPAGDRKGLAEMLAPQELTVVSKHKDQAFKRPMKFTGTLKDFQEEAVQAIIKKKKGIVRAPPRAGKTVLAAAAVCRIGEKTIILAAQREWLDGFYETFCGSETQKPLTNAKKSQVGFAKTYEDFVKYDVCLVTYQTFLSKGGRKLLERIRDFFPTLFVDEAHGTAATQFAIVLSKLNCKRKIGLTATPLRKDGKNLVSAALIGPIIYNAKVERLRPTVRLVRTQYTKHYKGRVLWTTMVSSLEKDPKRLKLIAEWALKDAKDGHMVLIPLAQVTPIKALCLAINRLAGKKVAHPFYGGLKKEVRKQTIQDARNYKARIIVGNTKLLSTGINIPRASAIFDATMSANAANAEQRVSRILTPWDDKPPPILRIFLDNVNVRRRCLNTEWWGAIKPIFKPIISERDEKILKAYLAEKDSKALMNAAWEL